MQGVRMADFIPWVGLLLASLTTLEVLFIFEDRGNPPRYQDYVENAGTFKSVRFCEECLPVRENWDTY